MAAMAGILFFGIIQGMLIGVVLSLLLLIARSSRPRSAPLGREPKSDTYLYIERHDGLETIPGVLVVRVDGPLFFADADRFRTNLYEQIQQAGTLAGVVVDAGAVHLTDTDGADILIQVAGELEPQGTTLSLAYVHLLVFEICGAPEWSQPSARTVSSRRSATPSPS